MGRAFSAFSAPGWGQAEPTSGAPGNLAIGVSIGSGYQYYFSALTSAEQTAEINRMKAAGITSIRMDVHWNEVTQPNSATTPSQMNWDYPKLTALPMLNAGMNVVMILWWSPGWARWLGYNTTNSTLTADPFATFPPSDYATFCGAAAAEFGPFGVHVFELWNEPNLDSGNDTVLGFGYLSPIGYASIATAAYTAIHAQYVAKTGCSPTPTVLGGALAGWPSLDYSGDSRPGASWPAVAAGAPTATIACAGAGTGDQYALICGTGVSASPDPSRWNGAWPPGTYISSVSAGVSYTVSPPPWMTAFPAIDALSPGDKFGIGNGYPPDVFLTQAYAAAAGATMFDALSMHPYTWPGLPAASWIDSGSWAMVPTIRQIMVANGDGAKAIWFTEVGAPSGQSVGSWPSATASEGQLVVSGSDAVAGDLGCLVAVAGLPINSYIAGVDPGVSWTVMPPTGLTVSQDLTPGATITQLDVTAAGTVTVPTVSSSDPTTVVPTSITITEAISIQAGTTLQVCLGNGNGYFTSQGSPAAANGHTQSFTVTTAGATRLSPGQSGTIDIAAVTVPLLPEGTDQEEAYGYSFESGGLIQCASNLGQTWAIAINSTSQSRFNLVAPGVLAAWGIEPQSQYASSSYQVPISSEAQQAAIIAQTFQSVVAYPWPYVGPIFVYCWSDISDYTSAGPFGLIRADGSAKPALAALTAIAQTGGRATGLGLPGLA